jgi:hypothetical protein
VRRGLGRGGIGERAPGAEERGLEHGSGRGGGGGRERHGRGVSAMAGARWRRWTRAPRQSRIGARPSPAEVAYVQIPTIPSELCRRALPPPPSVNRARPLRCCSDESCPQHPPRCCSDESGPQRRIRPAAAAPQRRIPPAAPARSCSDKSRPRRLPSMATNPALYPRIKKRRFRPSSNRAVEDSFHPKIKQSRLPTMAPLPSTASPTAAPSNGVGKSSIRMALIAGKSSPSKISGHRVYFCLPASAPSPLSLPPHTTSAPSSLRAHFVSAHIGGVPLPATKKEPPLRCRLRRRYLQSLLIILKLLSKSMWTA